MPQHEGLYSTLRKHQQKVQGPLASMDSEEEGRNDEEDEEEDGNQFLVGFMFGNVGTDMRLEEDYLDKASCFMHFSRSI